MSAALHVDTPEVGVRRITIDAPPSNALGEDLRTRLVSLLDDVDADLEIRAVILTGSGAAFCAGDDLREARGRGEGARASLGQFGRMLDRLEGLRAPVIAAVNGWAIGGGLELALCCDIRIAAQSAFFQGAGVNVGLMASVYRLPRLIGVGPAKAMLLTGERVDAATALRWGLITAVHPADALADAALNLARRIATRAPLSVEATKRMIGRAFDLDDKAAAAASGQELRTLAASDDHKAALAAFARRETPVFRRR